MNKERQLVLGRTTIGDLLLGGKITESNRNQVENDISLTIPNYQRPYKWTAKNACQLLDDILDAKLENKEIYRVGTLILFENETEQVYEIVDGQQRIITFSLLLRCLGESEFELLKQEVSSNPHTIYNISSNYKALSRKVKKLFPDEEEKKHIQAKNDLLGYIKERCEFIIVITNDLSEAFQFFDSQNARGKSLYPHDLLKAYHLREMKDLEEKETERIVGLWENLNQKELAVLFNDYLYRLKEWVRGNRTTALSEQNIDIFKGITAKDNYPYSQYYKGAFAYAVEVNQSQFPFVVGIQNINPFQINSPIIAGKPFFEYTKHYFDILSDIQNNDKYEGYFINDNEIVKTLDLRENKKRTGDRITRLMFDTAILLYVDRFCPEIPSKPDLDLLEQFIIFAFVWAYSMRLQYRNVGWLVAQNYILENTKKNRVINSLNIYKIIVEANSPLSLLNGMSDAIGPLNPDVIEFGDVSTMNEKNDEEVYKNIMKHFEKNGFWER